MAERRMFSKAIVDSDAFLDMPLSTQALYFHLGMRADDEGFINNPKKIQRMVGCSDDDSRLLVAKGFIIPFESGVVVIRHWKIHNYIQKDRYRETVYQRERAMLTVEENKTYTVMDTTCIQSVSMLDAQDRIGKDRKDKKSITARSCRPSLEEVREYCDELNSTVNPEAFIDHYTSNGWKVGNQPMKDWKAAVRNWERRQSERQPKAAAVKDTGFLTMEDIYGRKKG